MSEERTAGGQQPWVKGPFPYQDPTALTDASIKQLDEQVKEREQALQALLESKLENAKGIHEQKFEGIKDRFISNDLALQNAFKGNKDLIDAQNKANTDAAKKSEEAFKEQITALTTFMNASFAGLNKQVDDLKGLASASAGATANSNKIMSVIGLAVAILAALYATVVHVTPQQPVYVAPSVSQVNPVQTPGK